MPQKFSLADQFVNPNLEMSLLASMVADPTIYWETLDLLPPGVLTAGKAIYDIIAAAVEAETASAAPPVRPGLMTRMGLERATSRAAERKARAFPMDSM